MKSLGVGASGRGQGPTSTLPLLTGSDPPGEEAGTCSWADWASCKALQGRAAQGKGHGEEKHR